MAELHVSFTEKAMISVNKKMKDETREMLIINHNLFLDIYLKYQLNSCN